MLSHQCFEVPLEKGLGLDISVHFEEVLLNFVHGSELVGTDVTTELSPLP